MNQAGRKNSGFNYDCPPGLLALSVVFWSWHTNVWPVGIAMGIIVEIPRWMPARIKITDAQFVRLSNVSALMLLLSGIAFFTTNLERSIFLIVEWLPLITFLLLVAQLYSESRLIPLHALMVSMRGHKIPHKSPNSIDLRLPYFFITLISTSMVAPRDTGFFLEIGILIMWALWSVRSKYFVTPLWLVMIAMSFGLGFLIQSGLSNLQSVVQEVGLDWLQDWSQQDMSHKSTAIGQIGRLKMSNKIAMRIKSSEDRSILLRQASYNRYYGGSWHNSDSQFNPITHNAQSKHWNLAQRKSPDKHWLEIFAYLDDGEGYLALPGGSSVIVNQRSGSLQQNRYGSVKIENSAELLDLKIYFDPDKLDSSKPMLHDLELSDIYKEVTSEVVESLGLSRLPPRQAAQKLNTYFSQHFKYSLIQNEADIQYRPLIQFLRESRKGHCEYFATAGALILRAAGIPSRYISGYLMDEYQASTGLYIIRHRHAHAWNQAYIDGVWVDLDFTPSTWAALEAAAAPWWEALYDSVSHLAFLVFDWWWAKPRTALDYALTVFAILSAFFVLKKSRNIRNLLQWKKLYMVTTRQKPLAPTKDSPFYKIIHHLEKRTTHRRDGETVKQWLTRVIPEQPTQERMKILSPSSPSFVSLQQLVRWHYQYRFANNHIPLQQFEQAVDAWLSRYIPIADRFP